MSSAREIPSDGTVDEIEGRFSGNDEALIGDELLPAADGESKESTVNSKENVEDGAAVLSNESDASSTVLFSKNVLYHKPMDSADIAVVENPHFITLCRFLNIFSEVINIPWTFQELLEAVTTTEGFTELCILLFSRFFYLMGKKIGNPAQFDRVVSEFCKRKSVDCQYLFHKGKNPLRNNKEWKDLPPYQRLRVFRLAMNCVLGESSQIRKAIDNNQGLLDDSTTGLIGIDKVGDGRLYWYIKENQSVIPFKLYREDPVSGRFELLAEDSNVLQDLATSLAASEETMEVGKHLDLCYKMAWNAERANSRALRQKKSLNRQLEVSSSAIPNERHRRHRAVDYTFRSYDEQIYRAEREMSGNRVTRRLNEDVAVNVRQEDQSLDRSARLNARNAQKEVYYGFFPDHEDAFPEMSNGDAQLSGSKASEAEPSYEDNEHTKVEIDSVLSNDSKQQSPEPLSIPTQSTPASPPRRKRGRPRKYEYSSPLDGGKYESRSTQQLHSDPREYRDAYSYQYKKHRTEESARTRRTRTLTEKYAQFLENKSFDSDDAKNGGPSRYTSLGSGRGVGYGTRSQNHIGTHSADPAHPRVRASSIYLPFEQYGNNVGVKLKHKQESSSHVEAMGRRTYGEGRHDFGSAPATSMNTIGEVEYNAGSSTPHITGFPYAYYGGAGAAPSFLSEASANTRNYFPTDAKNTFLTTVENFDSSIHHKLQSMQKQSGEDISQYKQRLQQVSGMRTAPPPASYWVDAAAAENDVGMFSRTNEIPSSLTHDTSNTDSTSDSDTSFKDKPVDSDGGDEKNLSEE